MENNLSTINFEARGISATYGQQEIFSNLSFKLMDGKITAILGPNGSGKSTLLKALAGLINCSSGQVLINNQDIKQFGRKDLAKLLSILPQAPESPGDITVSQLVQHGRYAYSSWLNNNKKDDSKQVKWALSITNLTSLADKSMYELSGGERQRVWIAMSLAQNSKYLFLDEPTTYLDIRFQFEILNLLKNLNSTQNKTIVMVVHEIQHALSYADYILLINEGRIYAHATTKEIIDSGAIEEIFKIKIKQIKDDSNHHFVICNQ